MVFLIWSSGSPVGFKVGKRVVKHGKGSEFVALFV